MAGFATMPTFLTLVEHVSLSLLFRAAYKSFDGPYPLLAIFSSAPSAGTAVAIEPALPPSATGDDRLAA